MRRTVSLSSSHLDLCYNRSTFSKTIVQQRIHSYLYSRFLHTETKPQSNSSLNTKERARREFWKDQSNQRKFFDDLGKKIGVQSLDDWYTKLSFNTVVENGGSGILYHYQNSPVHVLMATYPEHNWIPWKFNHAPRGYWKSKENQRKYFDWLGKELGVKTLDDWYQKLSHKTFQECGGLRIQSIYNGSMISALQAVYPEHSWNLSKFPVTPRGYWSDPANGRKYFDTLAEKIGIQTLDDWYGKLSANLIVENKGGGLLARHKFSPARALMAAYPEHNWIPWKFNQVADNYWNSTDNVSKFLAELSEKLSIQTLDDWYRVDLLHFKQLGGSRLIAKYKGLYQLLKEHYPHHPWDPKRFQQKGKKAQRWLAVTLKKMFPNEEILEDYMHPKVMLPSSNRSLQLDVFIPSKSLAFEYQGIQHFQEVGVFSTTQTYQRRDEEKRVLCASNNIKLIEVPYWWNRTQESLQEIISKHS